ncbi:transcriptional regulator with AbiEi antitoxin N-terminal domain [Fodinibius salinus]|uniref:Transcriptional regulator with AbiEi antitoxin N-terminal domain n=1 Tax=Fodinibius salinus TaxID=860790 RepID=A0A5D3YM35_9BACT|nr:type IV toxin-antitoxin system AbiEi family antitoxin [Fodinibius salinus]TYP93996.1 transcriptional regulator with AbiEi antitoxin N-terminal domain [Fodinibius salinus]
MKKINQILQKWPQKTVITTDWLKRQGVSRQSVDNYKNSGWLERIGQGAYKREGDEISWEGALYALQKFQSLSIHVGGKTALELQGYGHYIKIGTHEKVILWKTPEVRLPSWFKSYDGWANELEVRSATLFSKEVDTLSDTTVGQVEVQISSAERAVLEYIYDVPKQEGFDEANYIMEGLASLRPKVLQQLLEACNSVRSKRLFMYLAEHHDHSWFKRLDPSKIDFGKGKREIIKGGKLNKKYKIVVPELSREGR